MHIKDLRLQYFDRCIGKYDLSVVMPTWNNLKYLQLCVSSIRKHSKANIQIIVLVNEGSDDTLDWLAHQEEIDYVHAPSNIGICYGLNSCRPLIKSDYIVYLNDDMYVLPQWDVALLQEIKEIGHNRFMLSSTMVEPRNTGNPCVIVQDYGDDIESFGEEALVDDFDQWFVPDWSGTTWPPNVVHVQTWDLVGGLSVEYSPGMYSDPDFAKKIYDLGIRIFKGKGNSLVYHFGSKSTRRVKRNTGRDMFMKKWGMTSGYFSKHILKMGQPYQELEEVHKMSGAKKLINRLKAMKASMH